MTPKTGAHTGVCLVKHYAEGTLMPLLVQKLMFTIIPQRSPFFARPLLSPIFANLSANIVDPGIKANADYVRPSRILVSLKTHLLYLECPQRSKPTS